MLTTFGIRATFPLGFYQAHRRDRSTDPFPDPARLHGALVNAACVGSTAVESEGRLRPSPAAIDALHWLEGHPPDGIEIPPSIRMSTKTLTAYRASGAIRKEGTGKQPSPKPYGRATSDGMALSGQIGWAWNGDVPISVRETLQELCVDVVCLGEASSPVVMELGEVKPNYLLDRRVSRFASGGVRVRVPVVGRFEALDEAFAKSVEKRPTASADRWSPSADAPQLPSTTEVALQELRYQAPKRVTTDAPWANAIRIDVTGIKSNGEWQNVFDARSRVTWAVALHRTLAARIGTAAPPLITGKYLPGANRPANRIAIHYMEAQLLALTDFDAGPWGAFFVLVPRGSGADDLLVLDKALRGLTHVRSRFGIADVRIRAESIHCDDFWSSPRPGLPRTWRTVPAMVAETRPAAKSWTFEDATFLSIGNVLRDRFDIGGRGETRYRALAEAVRGSGVSVSRCRRLHVDASDYVHRISGNVVVQPYVAEVEFGSNETCGSLSGDRRLMAIGQTRHLGGGLLVPYDEPAIIRGTDLK